MTRRKTYLPACFQLLLLLMLLGVAFTAPALAALPRTMSYQGVLTDDAGAPLPDGSYSLTFRLYNGPIDGSLLWIETHAVVMLSKGGFSVVLGVNAPLPSYPYATWLGVQVGADPELTPRVALAGAPWSLDLALPWTGIGNSTTPAMSLINVGSGPALEVQGSLFAKPEAGIGSGEFRAFSSSYETSGSKLGANANGGTAYGWDELGQQTWELTADGNVGTAGYMRVFRDAGESGFVVDGSYNGTHNPHVSILGIDRSAIFNMSTPDNSSVVLPNNAISAAEILDEPGAASQANTAAITIDETWETILTTTATNPAPGYVLGVAHAQVNVIHTQGTATSVEVGLTAGVGTTPQYAPQVSVPSTAPSGTYRFPVSVTHMTTTLGGVTSYMVLKANKGAGGTVTIQDMRVNTIYLPTSYGVVETLAQEAASDARPGDPGYAEALAAHEARLQKELDAMRIELQSIKQQIASEAPAQSAATPGR